MIKNDVSLWFLAAKTDVSFMMQTIPHLVRMCNFSFAECVLAIDTKPLSEEKRFRPNIGTPKQLRDCCNKLLSNGIVDKIIDIDFPEDYRKRAYRKHFGTSRIRQTHNWKGYPVLGSIFCIEEAKGDYFLHFDSDMLLYQGREYNWIEEGIRILREHPEVICVRPSAGPQSKENNLYESKYFSEKDSGGFYRLKGFSSRTFLIDRKRFEELLPLKILWAKKQGSIKDRVPRVLMEKIYHFTGLGRLESWEKMVTEGIKRKGFIRADIISSKSWTLHPCNHGVKFIEALPKIIEDVESGHHPQEQAGNYDLQLKYWI
ncbi:MAG: hypothetical protein JSW17_03595 [Candidatus Omnitrophota bacterium]|nr:MAG: hypothetical protein JSW17_03595 [Candidatus Omnitrophota bacterium]